MTALLCTGAFPRFRSRRPFVEPQEVLLGLLRGLSWEGRLGILTPSVPHVPQTETSAGAYFGYLPGDSSPIHNANMLVCAVLARLSKVVGHKEFGNAAAAGLEYTLTRQRDDGSWHVRSRAPKVQPYFQSGFPHDHDQWISSAATAWATAALAEAVEPSRHAAGPVKAIVPF